MKWTVFGASGFIGSYLVSYLRQKNYEVDALSRNINLNAKDLGHAVYCAGVTADFRRRPFDTIEAHVSLPSRLMENASFDSFLYLSSTRVYQKSSSTDETTDIIVLPEDPSDVYNISKIMGESICLNSGREGVRVARLSNILGFFPNNENFVDMLLTEAVSLGHIELRSAPESSKDYLFVDDVIPILERISLNGQQHIYNVASGNNITNLQIVNMIKRRVGCKVTIDESAPLSIFPSINNKRIVDEFAFAPSDFQSNFDKLIEKFSYVASTGQ